jgi:hypothetical protein
MNHDRQVLSPKKYMNRWRVGWFYGTEAAVSFIRCTSPDLQGLWIERLVVVEPGRILFSSRDYRYEEFDSVPVPGSPVSCPGRFRIEAVHGDDWLRGSYRLARLQEKKDILSDYPYLFRQLAKLITKETWSYRFWADFDFDFHQDGKTRKIKGTGTANLIEPVPADPTSWNVEDQFLFGSAVMVAPILTDHHTRNVWIPPGVWYDAWSGQRIQ